MKRELSKDYKDPSSISTYQPTSYDAPKKVVEPDAILSADLAVVKRVKTIKASKCFDNSGPGEHLPQWILSDQVRLVL